MEPGWRQHPRAWCRPRTSLGPTSSTRCSTRPRLELTDRTNTILADVERIQPTRVVFDSLSELRLLAGNPLRYRRQIACAQAVLSRAQVHGDAPRRPDRRPIATCRSRASRTASSCSEQMNPDYGRRAPPAARREVPRERLPRRLPGLRHPTRRSRRLPAAGGRRPSSAPDTRKNEHGDSGDGRLVGRRLRVREQHADRRRPGHGEVDPVRAVRRLRSQARSTRRRCSSSTRAQQVLLGRCAGSSASASAKHLEPGLITIQQVDPAELSPGEFMHAIRHAADGGDSRSS